MWNQFRYNLSRFMYGRCGMDPFNSFLTTLSLVLLLLSAFIRPVSGWLSLVALIILILTYVRMFSKNLQKRYAENQKYLAFSARVRYRLRGLAPFFRKVSSGCSRFFRRAGSWFSGLGYRFRQFRQYHIYKCPGCGQKIRIPRGKGNIMVRCPKCGTEFKKRS